ncbi:YqgE/AlgH family protein [Acuticoccus sp. I52.16.1]|uniref:YqgE/AlgH family protein n=1 Tax=Acuticoccus sp. I52.16.1 TaxID=2928472 RepID=UPI001FD4CD25|nr:YqgE/AlgH family protein [Acuticoccus sp. I52.16.1]UOM33370.1 YqgE/AlgH family protein [Acuticoccus sp. I52.16.1]
MDRTEGYLEGQCLIAMPQMGDERFDRAVVFLCAHSEEGAMGIIVNKPAKNVSFVDLLTQLGVVEEDSAIRLPDTARNVAVHNGGPVETGRGFVLHTSDFMLKEATLVAGDDVCLTATVEILRAIAHGSGPSQALLALGYAGWAPGQLEAEIAGNGWLHCAADHDLLFDMDVGSKYERAVKKLGFAPQVLSSAAGHA